jgi:head-tail adaptor
MADAKKMDRSRRHRITIQRKIERRSSLGDIEFEWQYSCETWADIQGDTITIRYQPELYPGDRVVIGKHHFYEITAVIDRKFRNGRLVELQVTPILGHGRACPVRFRDEQLRLRAFPESRPTQASGESES